MRLLLISLFFFIAGCSIAEKDDTLTWSVQRLYNEAKTSMDKGSLTKARSYYGKLLSRFPYGRYAQQSGLDLINLEYKDKEYDKAIAQADKFIQLYPRSPHADYARYMKGVIAYSRDVSMIDKLVPTNIAQSDQSMLQQAYGDFEELNAQNPTGEYSEDAKMRMVFLRNISAEHEIYVAEYYMRRGAFLAAVNRGQHVVSQYSRTPAVPLGLAVMVRSYKELKMPKLAADAQRILDKNYPKVASANSRLDFILNGNVRKKASFLSRIRRGLLTE